MGEVRRGPQNAPQNGLIWSDALEGGVSTVRADPAHKGLETAFANEDAGALFPGSLGEADTRAFHQHGPSHGLVPSGRRLDEVQRDAIDRGFRFQSTKAASRILTSHLSMAEMCRFVKMPIAD